MANVSGQNSVGELIFGSVSPPTSTDHSDNDTYLVTSDGTSTGSVGEMWKFDGETSSWIQIELGSDTFQLSSCEVVQGTEADTSLTHQVLSYNVTNIPLIWSVGTVTGDLLNVSVNTLGIVTYDWATPLTNGGEGDIEVIATDSKNNIVSQLVCFKTVTPDPITVSDVLCTVVSEYSSANAEAIYNVAAPRGGININVDNSGNVIDLFDLSSSVLDATQPQNARRPNVSGINRQNNRQYLEFDGDDRMLSSIDLNANTVNIFILYRTTSTTGPSAGPHIVNGLFGHDDGGWDKFVAFDRTAGRVFIAGTVEVGNGIQSGIAAYGVQSQINADPFALNVWNCLSVHWDGVAVGASRVYCNGKLLENFTHQPSVGSTTMTFGDLNPAGVAGFVGDVAHFEVYKTAVPDLQVRRIHECLRRTWGITGWDSIEVEN